MWSGPQVQGCIRAIISEIKMHEKSRLLQLKGLSHRRGKGGGVEGGGRVGRGGTGNGKD